MASAPISIADLPSNRPNGWRPTPMMATSFISPSRHGPERPRDDLVAVLVDEERHHRQLDLHAEPQLGGIALGQPRLDPHHVAELDQPDAERLEALGRLAAGVRQLRDE